VPRNPATKLPPERTLDPSEPLSSRGADRFHAIYRIGRLLLEQRDPQQVIRTIQQAIVDHLDPDHACVLVTRPAGGYEPVACHNLDLAEDEEDWPLSRSVLARTRDSGLAVLSADMQTDAQLGSAGSVHRYQIRSVMCVPLGQEVAGLIYVDNRAKRRAFEQDDLEFLTAIALYTSLALERARELVRANEALQASDERVELLQGELLRHEIVGRSKPLIDAYASLRRFARSGARVLLRGETGTGKELFARAYAASSPRARKAYVPVPVPALAAGLIESELFGHVRGAFTEASRDKKGRLELAAGGVLFLDEVGDIDLAIQPKLLRFLDSGELHRVGDTEPRRIDTLVVSATNRPLERAIEEGRFRADLLARLGQVVTIPPLRKRTEDIPLLVEHFLGRHGSEGRSKSFAPETLELLQRHTWPLNVRELQQVVERAVCLVDHSEILPDDLPEELRQQAASQPARRGPNTSGTPRSLREVVEEVEKEHILRTLEATGGNRRRAIEILKVSHDTFYRRLEEYGLHKKQR
jgi:transcriptional regulator with GAF, ATPase, and Fis domain